ncbi:hypothetical protein M8C21_010886 [Ambrosia artemisiifolia]|uniref:Carotenoid oxygenase n=1 Tax=Ambrosia artemisiifolia TaxID=4212 RepID=A0AAD5DET6_AMBAR|nr:hypothetical protein M8C21_010886 [Ambrosia artemisiifolia]
MLSRSHTPLLSHAYTNIPSPTNRFKYRPPCIVFVSRSNGEGLERRIIQKKREQERLAACGDSSELPFLEKIFNILDRAITEFLDPPLHFSVDPAKILSGNGAPVDELIPTKCEIVHGTIPSCLSGVYIRNGPNPQFAPKGPYHFLDGDGMVHSIKISHGRATFCSRYVKTNKYLFEKQVRPHVVPNVIGGMRGLGSFIARATLFGARVLFSGYNIGKGIGVANTNLAFLGGKLYALCESDIPYAIKIKDDGDVITLGHHDFNGNLSMNMTAHPKIDPVTKEAFAFRYWATRPYLTYFRFDKDGNKQPDVPIYSMKQPSLTHDLAITQKYAIICDIQVRACPMNLIRGEPLVGVDQTKIMSSKNLEFPVINPAYIGKKNKYIYAAIADQTQSGLRMMRASGVVKLDITASSEEGEDQHECTMASRMYENNCFGGEPFFIAREAENPNSEEDDGYVVSYVHHESSCESRFLVMDARSPTLEVVAVVKLPQRVPYGLHGIFIRENDLYQM